MYTCTYWKHINKPVPGGTLIPQFPYNYIHIYRYIIIIILYIYIVIYCVYISGQIIIIH